jgi:hypothetical protein
LVVTAGLEGAVDALMVDAEPGEAINLSADATIGALFDPFSNAECIGNFNGLGVLILLLMRMLLLTIHDRFE